jgi:hypothetical protein
VMTVRRAFLLIGSKPFDFKFHFQDSVSSVPPW